VQIGASTKTYKVITALGSEGSVTGNDLQGMNATIGNTSADYALGADIDATPTSSWNSGAGFSPLGGALFFSGTLHGLNHSITGLTINRRTDERVGLFGALRGDVRDLKIVGGSIEGLTYVGALAGSSNRTLFRVNASATVKNYAVSGTLSALGGLVGRIEFGMITACYATGAVSAVNNGDNAGGFAGLSTGLVSQSYATGNVTGGRSIGGFVGILQGGEISDAYATGNVFGTNYVGGVLGSNRGTLSRTYSTSVVASLGSFSGGVVGENGNTITGSYWNPTASGRALGVGTGSATGTTALTTAQTQQATSFVSLDFTSATGAWRLYEGHTTPLIRALLNPLTIIATPLSVPYDGTATPIGLFNASYDPAYAAGSPLIIGGAIPYGSAPFQPGTFAPDIWSTQVGFDITLANAPLNVSFPLRPLDIDDSFATGTTYHALTDGVLVVRGLLGLTGNALVTGVLGANAQRDAMTIAPRLAFLNRALDIDNNGSVDAATDGILVARYLLGFRGSALTGNALGVCPAARVCRASDVAIEAYLLSLTQLLS
jgi:hypothetical protein